jgi:cytochrome c-type biogenesis protein CcmE
MKKFHVIGIIVIALAIGVIVSLVFTTDQYKTFADADNSGNAKVTIIGEMDEKAKSKIEAGPNSFSFFMTDKNGETRKVVVNEPMPTDFEKLKVLLLQGRWREAILLHPMC